MEGMPCTKHNLHAELKLDGTIMHGGKIVSLLNHLQTSETTMEIPQTIIFGAKVGLIL
jgi:hypothetical protein